MLKPIALSEGHYECRSLDETLPIFTDLLAAQVIERTEHQATVKASQHGMAFGYS
jgi:hypothetical protein